MTTAEGRKKCARRHTRVSSLDQLELDKAVCSRGKKDNNAKVSQSMFNLRTAAVSDEDGKVTKRPPSGRKQGVHDGNVYLARDLESGEEEVVVCHHGNDPNLSCISSSTHTTLCDFPKAAFPPRLLIVSSKIRSSVTLRNALQPNVICVQYRYDSATLDEILSLVEKGLSSLRVVSIAFVLSCSGSSILLSGKEDRAVTRETLQESHPVHQFLRDLVTAHLEVSSAHCRIDFLACHAALSSDGRQIANDLQSMLNIPVGISKDIEGQEISRQTAEGEVVNGKSSVLVGSLYFNLERLRGWGGHYQQSLAGFEKIRTVGKGAYGAAVLYRKKDDDSLVILKEINMHDLNAAERNLALNEVKVLAMLDHPNIISYYDSFEEDGVVMIEMEYADGGTMAQFLAQQEQPLEEKEILAMFQQVVAAIRHVHEHNILHRDLKTANIFLTKEGVVKVGDFGISKMLSSANKGANTVLGTPYYISPEMCEGKDYNDRSDIWALGCILYELACLQKTFEGSNLPALVNKIMKGQFAPVKGSYSPELKQLIAELLLQKPEDRPSANEILYHRLPEMLSRYEEVTSDFEDDLMSSAGSAINKKKRVRSVLYYLDTSTLNLTPIELPSRLKIREVAVGADHVIAVTMERQVYTWGEGSQGQLGHGDQQSRHKPQLVDTLKGKSICRVSCGQGFSVFGSDNGIVMTCGAGESGCLGHGDWCNALRPRLIEPLLSVDVVSLACGPRHVAVVGSAGEIFSWGCGENGRLGLGTEENHCQPMEVIALEDLTVTVREVYCGLDGTMFLTDVGSVYACGNNEYNKLGLNNRQGFLMAMKNIFTKTEVEGKKAPTPVRALGRHRVVDVAMGPRHSAVVVDPGIIYTFGINTDGQLGTGNTKPQNAPTEIKLLSNSVINRVQCGENYTSASSAIDELFFWGLRYKTPPTAADQGDSLNSSGNGNLTLREKDDTRMESVTPRKGGHSRQASNASVNSIISAKDVGPTSPEAEGHTNGKTSTTVPPSPERQVSNDSVFLHGDEATAVSADSTQRAGFRPLGSAPRRSLSASSTSKEKEKDKEVPEGAERILNPTLILRLMDTAEVMSLASFYCHGENLLVQVETTAPPPARRKSRKKRSFRKRFSRNLVIPSAVLQGSASSREGGDEYSSEASEMDSQGPLPDWLKEELAVKDDSYQGEVVDGDEADDTSDLSEDEVRRSPVDDSMSRIQVNRELKTGQNKTSKKKISPRTERTATAQNEHCLKVACDAESSSGRGRSLSVHSGESGEQEVLSSSGSEILAPRNETRKLKASGIPVKKVTIATNLKIVESPFKKPSGVGGQKPLSKIRAMGRGRGRLSIQDTRDQSEQLTARGFVSDVTVKRREETLQNELEKMRDEKRKAEEKIEEMERRHRHELEQRHLVVARKAQETEAQLKGEIEKLRRELLNHSSQLQNNQKVVLGLQEQLVKVEAEQRSLNSQKLPGSNSSTPRQGAVRESKVCVLQ